MGNSSKSITTPRRMTVAGSMYTGGDIPNLDFLRAVAVMLVLFGHLMFYVLGYCDIGPFRVTHIGSLGVLFFFVHTCFVLMLSIERQRKRQRPFQLFGSFMIRRIFRIYPLSITVVLLIAAFRLPQYRADPGHFFGTPLTLGTMVSNLLLIQGFGHWLLGMLWTLPYEMAMYLFLPWIFLYLLPNRSLWRAGALWLVSVFAGILFLEYSGWPNKDYFLLYSPCFLPGVIAYQLQRRPRRRLPALLWAGVVVSVMPLYLLKREPFWNWNFKNWFVCLVIGLAVPFFAQISTKWITIPSHLIAKYSYGIYLTHFFCIWLAFERLHYVLPRLARLALFATLVIVLPVLFYHFLEEPMITFGKRVAARFETGIANKRFAAVRIPG